MMQNHIAYHWRRSPRAKSLQVHITPWNGIEVVIPRHVSRERARAFVAKHRQWIRDTWERMRVQIADSNLTLPAGMELRALGEHWEVKYRSRAGGRARVTSRGHVLTVHYDGVHESSARQALRRWLMERARAHFEEHVAGICRYTGFHYKRIQIRGQTSRWGSCSSRGTLSLNYKLLFLEPELVRYLVIHELSHTRYLDHSTRFWKLVEQFEPKYAELDQELGESWRDVPAWVEIR